MHRPGIEPGPPAWQASILPLNHRCTLPVNWRVQFIDILLHTFLAVTHFSTKMLCRNVEFENSWTLVATVWCRTRRCHLHLMNKLCDIYVSASLLDVLRLPYVKWRVIRSSGFKCFTICKQLQRTVCYSRCILLAGFFYPYKWCFSV